MFSLKVLRGRKGEVGATIAIVLLAVSLLSSSVAYAADLTYSVNTTIDLSDPDINLTILAGSTATSLSVGTGSFAVTVPQGARFTVTSASRNLTTSGGTSDGTISVNCGAGVATFEVLANVGSQTITVTPTSSACGNTTAASAGGGSSGGGGGGGGGGSYIAPTTPTPIVAQPTTPTTSATVESLKAQLITLQTQLLALLKIAAERGIVVGTPSTIASAGSFASDLFLGSRGANVRRLQEYLIARATGPAARALKANGTSLLYGNLTKAAVREFQASVGISATGGFGPLTRGYVNSH